MPLYGQIVPAPGAGFVNTRFYATSRLIRESGNQWQINWAGSYDGEFLHIFFEGTFARDLCLPAGFFLDFATMWGFGLVMRTGVSVNGRYHGPINSGSAHTFTGLRYGDKVQVAFEIAAGAPTQPPALQPAAGAPNAQLGAGGAGPNLGAYFGQGAPNAPGGQNLLPAPAGNQPPVVVGGAPAVDPQQLQQMVVAAVAQAIAAQQQPPAAAGAAPPAAAPVAQQQMQQPVLDPNNIQIQQNPAAAGGPIAGQPVTINIQNLPANIVEVQVRWAQQPAAGAAPAFATILSSDVPNLPIKVAVPGAIAPGNYVFELRVVDHANMVSAWVQVNRQVQ